jgi:uracil-DNA glycosylase
MLSQAEAGSLATLARALQGIDLACYARHGRDPLQPLIGLGRAQAPLCFMGRDPGAAEVAQWQPFVGGSGQQIRRGLAAHLFPARAYSEDLGLRAGDAIFWMNTVPYKPVDNKPWPLAVRRRFHALLLPLLARHWQGRDVVTFGTEAFAWFGLGQGEAVRQAMERFWQQPDRFEASLPLQLACGGGTRAFTLHPLPHPSPANARWKKVFPDLLRHRLQQLLPRAA